MSCTGHGESIFKVCLSYQIAGLMRQGKNNYVFPFFVHHGGAFSIPMPPAYIVHLYVVCPSTFLTSPLKELGHINSNIIWRIGEWKSIQMYLVT